MYFYWQGYEVHYSLLSFFRGTDYIVKEVGGCCLLVEFRQGTSRHEIRVFLKRYHLKIVEKAGDRYWMRFTDGREPSPNEERMIRVDPIVIRASVAPTLE